MKPKLAQHYLINVLECNDLRYSRYTGSASTTVAEHAQNRSTL